MPAFSDPRYLALRALLGVLRDHQPLDGTLDRLLISPDGLTARDRALLFAITIGTIRHLTLIDHLLSHCMQRPLAERRHETWAILRTGLYQILFMRVPARAAIHEAVRLVKASREQAMAGFVNAVLRQAATLQPELLLAKQMDPLSRLAVTHSHPRWLVERWLSRWGETVTQRRLAAGNQPGMLTLRINTLVTNRENVADTLKQKGFDTEPCRFSPHGLRLPNRSGRVEDLPGYDAGWFMVQDEAAQLVSLFVDPQPGEHILDACAAPGGKTLHLAALAQGKATILALEKRAERLPALAENLVRLRSPGVRVAAGDATDAEFLRHALTGKKVDAALVDGPCSGTGIIRRHPDIKWRRRPEDVPLLVTEQQRLLTAVAEQVRPGGRLVYATCSMEPEENQEQIATFLAAQPAWERLPLDPVREGVAADMVTPEGDFFVESGQEGMDGFYAARLQKSRSHVQG
ncbi:MAG: 16S rRNA (cytosine(967)-C(5))-methyltransferase RsmB [Magnetococcales bacterium]|nr:16S rRNA (cytosine(967)-C(5))-methyltransferase RsmB [Magnetococcales bacterium]